MAITTIIITILIQCNKRLDTCMNTNNVCRIFMTKEIAGIWKQGQRKNINRTFHSY